METIFVEITWKTGTKAEAIEAAKAIVERAGHEAGSFEVEQDLEDNSVVGNLEVSEDLYKDAEEDGEWSGEDGNVRITFETP